MLFGNLFTVHAGQLINGAAATVGYLSAVSRLLPKTPGLGLLTDFGNIINLLALNWEALKSPHPSALPPSN